VFVSNSWFLLQVRGFDDTKFNKDTLVTVENVSEQGFWEADIEKVTADGVDLDLGGRTAILDSKSSLLCPWCEAANLPFSIAGTTLLIAPQDDVEKIHKAIGGKADEGGRFTLPCNTNATLALSFGGRDFVINPKDLAFFPLTSNPTGDCLSGISAGDIGVNTWLVGDTFLKSVYFSTNVDKNSISLAELA
jgi:hypothetical protein